MEFIHSLIAAHTVGVSAAILIIAYILIVFVCSHGVVIVTYYSKMGPYIPSLDHSIGWFNGGKSNEISETRLIFTYSLGVAAEGYDGKTTSLVESKDSYYQPLNSYDSGRNVAQGKNINRLYNANINTYLAVGFKYVDVTSEELEKIKAWENENPGKHILYPLIADNDYAFDDGIEGNKANYWYKSDAKLRPISTKTGEDKIMTFSENLVLEDNYMRDDANNLVYSVPHGVSMTRIRVLYYNYYIYQYGSEPSYIFGTDFQGYDLAIRLAKGIRLSLILAVIVSVVNFIIGAIYGAMEGYYGGAVDLTMERITDILSGMPFIVVATLFQIHLAPKVGPIPSIIFAFILTGWIGTAATVRMQFYRFKNQEYVMAARTLGAKDRRIIWKHIFPNTLGTIITSSVLVIPGVIFSESMLSFLGIINLGGSTSTSLGTLLNEASGIWVDYPHMMIAPGLVISLLMICFNLFGNGLRDAFNPTLRGSDN